MALARNDHQCVGEVLRVPQAVQHSVPGEMMDELFAFDGSLWVHRTRGEMNAQCDLEAHNNIALNLGHEVAMGRRTVADARAVD